MKKVIFKILASLIAFFGTLYLSSYFMNKGNVNTTQDMEMASLPVVYMNVGGETVNRLYGYTQDMDLGLLRENITPLDEDRGVSFRAVKYGKNISSVFALVRTVDGSRLIEKIEIDDYHEDDYAISGNIYFKDLMDEYKEYSLQIYLCLIDGREVFYHTRIIEAPSYCPNEKIAFVRDFVKQEMSTDSNINLKTYMESNKLGDNTTLAHVDIHSSLSQLAFGDLKVTRETEPVINIKELASETGVFLVDYIVSSKEDNELKKYYVSEYYRIKYTPEVTYLLDYKRDMTEIPLNNTSLVRGEDILLGINGEDIGLIESDDGNVIAFTDAGTLYSFNISESKIGRLFSFYDENNFDIRTIERNVKIKALRVDEAGNVWFSVSGYMARGNYEGRVGICLYKFNGVTNQIEELFFIPSDKSPEIVNWEINNLCYLSREYVFYVMLDNTIYTVDIESGSVESLISDLKEDKYSVSADSTMMVWQSGDDVNASTELTLLNLNTKQTTKISAPAGQYIKPLAFFGEDFVYGQAYSRDVFTDNTGRTIFPMYIVKIQSKFGETLKQYSQPDIYVTQVSIRDNLLTLSQVVKKESDTLAYETIESEYITNNQEQTELQNKINQYAHGVYEKVQRIILKKDAQKKVIQILPKEVIYEGSKELIFERDKSQLQYYYVYYEGALKRVCTNPANAVTEADSMYGTVLNEDGYYVWYRANRDLRNQIMSMSENGLTDDGKNELAYCLDSILGYEGVVRNTEFMLSHGDTVISILEDGLENCDVLDLTGCSLDSILYYVNRDIPVLALTHTSDTYLVLGFNPLAVVLLDPNEGWKKVGMNEAVELFENNGNQFITYVYNNS